MRTDQIPVLKLENKINEINKKCIEERDNAVREFSAQLNAISPAIKGIGYFDEYRYNDGDSSEYLFNGILIKLDDEIYKKIIDCLLSKTSDVSKKDVPNLTDLEDDKKTEAFYKKALSAISYDDIIYDAGLDYHVGESTNIKNRVIVINNINKFSKLGLANIIGLSADCLWGIEKIFDKELFPVTEIIYEH